jgi:ribosome maturation factor RimP
MTILFVLSFLALLLAVEPVVAGSVVVDAFSILPQKIHWTTKTSTTPSSHFSITLFSTTRKPSKVSDPSGPSPIVEEPEPELIDLKDIPEAHYDENNHPIPHQPWRRGLTFGCEDPIDAEWRREAERRIKLAVNLAGGTYIDTTWYLTWMDVTIGDDFQDNPLLKTLFRGDGPEIKVVLDRHSYLEEDKDYDMYSEEGYSDVPKPLWEDEDAEHVFFERDVEGDAERANRTYAPAEEGESDDDLQLDPMQKELDHFVDKEYREDMALRVKELRAIRATKLDEEWHPLQKWDEKRDEPINTGGLSVIANAILEALEEVEEELQILSRHKLVMSAVSPKRFLDTQKEFDNARGKRVRVRTHDPWNSNRSLYGVLVDRNSLDVYINQRGNLVTIPNNFVGGVELMEDFEEIPDEEAEYEDEDGDVTANSQSDDMDDEEEYEEEEYEEEEDYEEDEEDEDDDDDDDEDDD